MWRRRQASEEASPPIKEGALTLDKGGNVVTRPHSASWMNSTLFRYKERSGSAD